MARTHTCGELTGKEVGKKVSLSGWVSKPRDHGGLIFIDLRDRYGITQIVFEPNNNDNNLFSNAESLRREFVISVSGKVRNRPDGMINKNIQTGEIEVLIDDMKIINKSEVPPLEIDDKKVASDEMRMKYRYLDLRRPQMQENILMRHKFITAAREYFNKNSFLEVETPMLVKATPEGARDYVVPSRVNPGTVYALPQSPQLYKQILMIAGFDRYYQVAKCLRDEDLRADRQPEHTQIDFEMSFVTQEEIQNYTEGMLKFVFKKAFDIDVKTPFPVIGYKESMDKYGTDKPDLRYGLELTDVSEIVKESDFSVFKSVVESGGIVKVINPESNFARKELDKYIAFAQENGSKGLAWMRVTEKGELDSNIAKFFNDDIKKKLVNAIKPKANSVLMFIADKPKKANAILDKLRRKLADDLNLTNPKNFKFAWINDFPLFAWNEDDDRWEPEHHMFSMPKEEFIDTLEENPGAALGDLWDLTLNGWEMSSGSIRVSNPDLQKKIMKIIGMDEKIAYEKFGFLLDAYKYGAPSHGGMGMGIARFLAVALGYDDIREVITFPKNKAAQCPMDGCPSPLDLREQKELSLKFDVKNAKKK